LAAAAASAAELAVLKHGRVVNAAVFSPSGRKVKGWGEFASRGGGVMGVYVRGGGGVVVWPYSWTR
jgi:hypothetical protein